MKTLLISCAISAAIGAGVAWVNAMDHYEDKARELREATAKAEQVRADKAQGEVDELFKKWKSAVIVPEPVVRVERVFVKAAAGVCADQGREMDHDRDAVRFELDSGSVRGVVAVTDKHERLYTQCAAQLRAAQALLKAE